ncbi:MAG TPA: 50S ribosomal protein L3 [Candidatus Acetothermia bacterium]|nr:50S ribosomal protein L3 [Candidatus Bipolaricaulota bacterium]RLD04125.1 MAG: 50S ribosomal protein L3 [Chloroflexota bacterium]HDO74400.1 50S ribosomal protein L3 [Candidatus Acetothermia bacterium]HEX32342.1 50S ribosomal protein L3 [Candidatus Acetothermia bacterium]
MALGILARKIGMTQLFVDGSAVGTTVIEAQPSTVVQVKTVETDGYNALQLGYDEVPERKVTKPLRGHFGKAGVAPHRHLFEVRIDDPDQYKVGDRVDVGIFEEGDKIDVIGTSRGLGFQGVVKRWNFAGGPKTHGSHFHRRPGSVGNCVNPGRVVKGKKLPGQTGNKRVTAKSLRVVKVDVENNLVVVKGSTPGAKGTVLQLRKSNG